MAKPTDPPPPHDRVQLAHGVISSSDGTKVCLPQKPGQWFELEPGEFVTTWADPGEELHQDAEISW